MLTYQALVNTPYQDERGTIHVRYKTIDFKAKDDANALHIIRRRLGVYNSEQPIVGILDSSTPLYLTGCKNLYLTLEKLTELRVVHITGIEPKAVSSQPTPPPK